MVCATLKRFLANTNRPDEVVIKKFAKYCRAFKVAKMHTFLPYAAYIKQVESRKRKAYIADGIRFFTHHCKKLSFNVCIKPDEN